MIEHAFGIMSELNDTESMFVIPKTRDRVPQLLGKIGFRHLFVSICNSYTAKTGLDVTDLDFAGRHECLS